MDCDVRDSVMFRLDSLRHLVVRCAEIANVPREVTCRELCPFCRTISKTAIYIWTRIDTRQAGFSHRTEGDLTCTAYPGNGIHRCSLTYPQIICNTFFKQQLKRFAKSGNRRYCCNLQKHVSS